MVVEGLVLRLKSLNSFSDVCSCLLLSDIASFCVVRGRFFFAVLFTPHGFIDFARFHFFYTSYTHEA